MESPHSPRTAWLALAILTALLVPPAAYAQTGQVASLLDALSLISGGMLVAPPLTPEITQDGGLYRVRIPLPTLTAPQGAAIEATATPIDPAAWDLTDLTLPQTSTFVVQGDPGRPAKSSVISIGSQSGHARIDPTLASPSSYKFQLGDIALHDSPPAPPTDHITLGSVTFEGTIAGDTEGRMTARSYAMANNGDLAGTSSQGFPGHMSLQSFSARYDVDGLDRAKAANLREMLAAVAASQPATGSMSPLVRERLRAIFDASDGLLSRLNVAETLHGLHFELPNASGDISDISLNAAGETRNDHVAGHMDIGFDDMILTSVPAQFAPYIPRRIDIKAAFSGLQAQALRQFLKDATAPNANPDALQARAIALLNEPGAAAGIESMVIQSGPLLVTGSSQVRPLPDGSAALDVHLTARGVDAMLALVQADPRAQQMMPMLFMAKGMGKPEGDSIVWDIDVANGAVLVNGVPFGHRGGAAPAARPPINR